MTMETRSKPLVDKTTGISIGLAVLLGGLIIAWTTTDATFKSDMTTGLTQVNVTISEIKEDLEEDQADIVDLKVRLALVENELEHIQ